MNTLLRTATLFIFMSLTLGACKETGFDRFLDGDPIDRTLGLTREDYRDMYEKKKGQAESSGTLNKFGNTPQLAPVLAAPRPPRIGDNKMVSLAVTDDVPLKDVLIELAKLADVDLELDANIRGGIAFRAKDRPFSEVIERISDLAGLRYTYKGGVLRVERDLPYIHNYPIDFLNVVRSSQSNVNITTDILSIASSAAGGGGTGGAGGGASGGGGGAGGGAQGLTTGSSTTIDTSADDDFWLSMEANIQNILSHDSPSFVSGGATPIVTETGSGAQLNENTFYVINRQAGVLSVAATAEQHEGIRKYLMNLARSATSQVLIEAKIVEVELDESFRSGINWNLVEQEIGSGNWNLGTAFAPEFDSSNVFTAALNPSGAGNIDAIVNLAERFGTTRTLSSPRLHAVNNQPAVLTFAENRVFFEVEIEQQPDQINANGTEQQGQISVNTTRRSIPIGIILNILPSINLDRNEVTLSVRPTLTRQVDEIVDPGAAFASEILIDNPQDRFTNTVPIVEVRELDSIMRLRSGQVMVIGGLMEQIGSNTDEGIPFLSGVPFLGNLFKGVTKSNINRELVIFIRASIVTPQGSYSDADERVYNKFTNDPRPIAF